MTVVVAVVVVLGIVTTLLVWTLRNREPKPGEPAAERYGFNTDGGAAWAPESGRLVMTKRGAREHIAIGFRFRTRAELDRLDGRALELRLAVRTIGPCGAATGWTVEPAGGVGSSSVRGLPKEAQPYVAVGEGRTCTETLVRIGSSNPGKLHPGRDYTVTTDIPAGSGEPIGATLTVARRTLGECGRKSDCVTGTVGSEGPDVEELVSADRGWQFNGNGCRRWFADATTSFPCLTDRGTRIMTLGDSITAGAIGDHTWRYWAWQKLDPSSHPTWVGSNTETWTGDYAVPHTEWASKHDSQAGVTAETVVGWVPRLMVTERPDVVLVDLGTNDTHPLHGSSAADAAADLERIVDEIQAANPRAQILLGQPDGHHDVALSIMAQLSVRIAGIAAARTTSDSLVSVVDLRTGWNRDIDTYDGTHPTQAGEYFLASRFVNRLAGTYAFGRVFGSIPKPPVPAAPTDVKALAQHGGLLLAWDRVPQSSEYRVYLRDSTAGGDFQRVSSGSREMAWGRNGLALGHQYDYYVTAVSAERESKPSTIGSVRAR
ncbi:GDSL-type esterase/lipase family protein [Cryptosporangium sp. NPDC051539]|uniref:GDSL-type esterase/lipase family protein n=1 Tax=Cryptosporangium sp. NPDC051539 TaxID=3363962 RepID=UPI0037A8C050